MGKDDIVINHYQSDTLLQDILRACGTDAPDIDTLSNYDEFHLGGRAATACLAERMSLTQGAKVLDAGCGIGGAARYWAAYHGVHVTGVDLTPDFIETATALSEIVGLQDKTSFALGSVTNMPFADHVFDAAYTIHVGMNVTDKLGFYQDVKRVLKPDSLFAVYDVCGDQARMNFPLPWATEAAGSTLVSADEVKGFLQEAGFAVFFEENRSAAVLEGMQKVRDLRAHGRLDDSKQPAHMKGYAQKISNLLDGLEKDVCAPWIFLCRA